MATISMVATVDTGHLPPRVKLDVTDTGSPAITTVRVTRTDPDGSVRNVRTEDGLPLTLLTSGSNRVGTVYDYEMPYGVEVVYSTDRNPSLAKPVTVDEERIWLVHPGVPSLSTPITLMRGSLDEEEEGVAAGVFFPLGRRNAVVISDGQRKAPSGTLIVGTEVPADRQALKAILADAFPLLLNVPPVSGIDVDTSYIHVGAVRRARPSDIGTDPRRNWVLPFQVVEAPAGGSQSLRTWADVISEHATWSSVIATHATWADLLAPTS